MAKKVLFLQPKRYYERLGVDFSKLDFYMDFGCISTFSFIYKMENYSLVVNAIDHSIFNRRIVSIANENGIETLYIADGIFEWSNATVNPFLCKKGIKLLHPFYYSKAIVMDDLLNGVLKRKGVLSYMYSKRIEDFERSDREDFCVLLTTANNPYFNDKEKDLFFDIIGGAASLLRERGIKYKWRVFDRELIDVVCKDDFNHTDGRLCDVLKDVDCVITTPSTLISEVASVDIPVAVIDYRDGPLFSQSAWRITSKERVIDVVKSMMARDDARMKMQRDLLIKDRDINEAFLDSIKDTYFERNTDSVGSKISLEYLSRCVIEVGKDRFSKLYRFLSSWLKSK